MRIVVKYILIFLLGIYSHFCVANMASPIWHGTLLSAPLTSNNIDIVKETIHLTLDTDLRSGNYVITYYINTDSTGLQVPLLFHALDYERRMKIWVDDEQVEVLESYQMDELHDGFLEKFRHQFDSLDAQSIKICWYENECYAYNSSDLKYFEANLSKGAHTIRVEYQAEPASDKTGWVEERSFRYSLSPAKYWRSFGALEITIDNSQSKKIVTSNLGKPYLGSLDSIAVWKFNSIPQDFIYFVYKPEINNFAKILTIISPLGFTGLLLVFLFYMHYSYIKKYRLRNPNKKVGTVLIVGSLASTFFVLIAPTIFYVIIDFCIGPDASNFHGYVFLTILFFPILLPIYWAVMWLCYKIYIQ